MSNNYLIIGLGGTGGRVIQAFRKAVFEEFRSKEPVNPDGTPHPVHLKYLYVDSSRGDLAASEKWRTHGDVGADIGLDEESRFSITANNLAIRLADPENHPVTHRYIGNPAFWNDIFSSMNISETAGGQIRRLGVALFEPRCTGFMQHITGMVNELVRTSGQDGVRFHICCGLAGGTGSGTFLPIIAQLRACFRDPMLYPIYLYILLPEPNSPWAANGLNTNYYANGYAALLELNAYLVSDPKEGPNKGGPLFSPIDLTGATLRFENPSQGNVTKLKDRLQGCFILSNVNEENRVISVQEIPELFAQLLYQRTFQIDSADPDRYRAVRDAISLENLATPDEGKRTNPDVKLRSVRFQGFGLKRVVVPEEEIREHFASSFALQAVLQMRYNNWPEGIGTEYLPEKKKASFKEFVQKEENRARWKLTDEQITLSQGILPAEVESKLWKEIGRDWQEITPRLKGDAWDMPKENKRDPRLDGLQKLFQDRFNETFRGMGVNKFYETKTQDLGKPDRQVAEIRDALESWMLTEWLEGRLSVSELETLLDDLLEDLEARVKAIPERLEKLEEREQIAAAKVTSNRNTWAAVGLIATALGKPAKIFDAQAECLQEQFEVQTWRRAWSFAQVLLNKVISELRDQLKPEVADFRNGLDAAIRFFGERIDQTCQEAGQDDIQQNVVKFYEPARVRKFCRTLLEAEQLQRTWAGTVRRALVAAAEANKRNSKGREKLFAMLDTHGVRAGDLVRVLEEVSRNNAETAHADNTGATGRFIGVNIVAKMAEQFSDEEKLKDYVKNLVRSAQTFMKYETVEFGGGTGPAAVMAVILPECPEKAAFRDKLSRLFIGSQGPGVSAHIINSGRKANEITLISFKYAFPLRWLQPVKFLKERYDFRLAQGSRERAILEVHIEDHQPELPSVFRPPAGQPGEQIIPLLQLTVALGLLRREANRQTGGYERVLEIRDPLGLPREYYYPDAVASLLELPAQPAKDVADLKAILRSTTEEQVEILEDSVTTALAAEKYRLSTEREALKQTLREQVDAVRQNRDNSTRDEIYLKFRDGTAEAMKRVDTII
jgi:hypothetical protein